MRRCGCRRTSWRRSRSAGGCAIGARGSGPLVCAGVGIGLTAPFLYPYAQLRALGQPPRPMVAVVQYSADTYAWLTANEQLRFWGSRLQTLVRPEGDLFPGVVPLLLVLVALALAGLRRWRESAGAAGVIGRASCVFPWHGFAGSSPLAWRSLAVGHVAGDSRGAVCGAAAALSRTGHDQHHGRHTPARSASC